ncbi:hypothetical protein ACWIGW_44225 [Nocardia brasiliensis]|uniref:hypothetical protein n=1 Tax=Streptomyces sp. NPDC056056 TaxID=3345698 RepID=UPI0035D702DA
MTEVPDERWSFRQPYGGLSLEIVRSGQRVEWHGSQQGCATAASGEFAELLAELAADGYLQVEHWRRI